MNVIGAQIHPEFGRCVIVFILNILYSCFEHRTGLLRLLFAERAQQCDVSPEAVGSAAFEMRGCPAARLMGLHLHVIFTTHPKMN